MPYDLFISYSRRDNQQGRITELVERIKADFAPFAKRELVPFFDQQEIHGMQDWRQRILQGLRESRLLLACLSPAYLLSEYCEWEFVEYLKYEIGHLHGFNGVAPIYFVEVPGWGDKGFEQQCAEWVAELRKRQHFDLRPWHDQGEAALRETAVQERMGKLNHQIVQTITRGERADKSLGNVDAHNPHFIGRTANLRMLRENFVKPGHIGVVTAVNGVGGLGKTALAIEYSHAFADEYGGGRWQVRCAGKDDLRLALAELATPIGIEFNDDEKKNADLQFDRVRRELKKLADAREPHRCLLILDNVDKPSLLEPAMVARLNGGDWLHILATTRLGENELHGAHKDRSFVAIDELPEADALALIESYQPNGQFRGEAERDAARQIVRLLGCFTLAVESAAVYLGQFANDVTCAAFLARLKKEGLEGLDTAATQSSEGVLHGEKRLSATLQPTLERLRATEKLALEFAALLPPDQVPLPWLRALVAKTFPEMERDAEPGHPDPWRNLLRRLFSLRLFQPTAVMDADSQPLVVRVHRLVQELIATRLNFEAQASLNSLVIGLVLQRADIWEQEGIGDDRWELTCLENYVRHYLSTRTLDVAKLASAVSTPLQSCGDVIIARDFLEEARGIINSLIESKRIDSSEVLPTLHLVLQKASILYLRHGPMAKADERLESSVILGRGWLALETANPIARNALATSLYLYSELSTRKGNIARAKQLLDESISLFESIPGLFDADLHFLFGFTCALERRARVAEAENNLEAARKNWERICEHRKVLATRKPDDFTLQRGYLVALDVLSALEFREGNLDSAEVYTKQCLDLAKSLAARFPQTVLPHRDQALEMSRLAGIARQRRDIAKAADLYQESHRILEDLANKFPDVTAIENERLSIVMDICDLALEYRDVTTGDKYCAIANLLATKLSRERTEDVSVKLAVARVSYYLSWLARLRGDEATSFSKIAVCALRLTELVDQGVQLDERMKKMFTFCKNEMGGVRIEKRRK